MANSSITPGCTTPLPTVSVIILTHNEARHVGRAIASVQSFASDILVVDSFSKDDTVEIAQRNGARVLHRAWKNYSDQFQWALDYGDISSDWIMRLDADEIIEPDLAAEIVKNLPLCPSGVAGINFDRKHIFMDRWIRHGGRYPLRLLRLWRSGQGRIEQRWMDEHIVVEGGRTVTFRGGFADINLNDLSFFTEKHNKYATREAVDVLIQRHGMLPQDLALSTKSASRQAGVKRLFKERLYNKLPFWAGPLGYFIYRYFFQLGFLDGGPGLIYHFLQGFWYRFLVGAKVEELEAELNKAKTTNEKVEILTTFTGLRLNN